MNLRSLLAVGICATSGFAAPVPKELRISTDAERIQGLWKDETGAGGHWKIHGTKMSAGSIPTPDAAGNPYGFVLRTAASPGEFDLSGAGTFVGIYRFVGDDLQVAYNPGPNRPKNFDEVPGNHVHLMKRVPEAGK